MHLLAGKEDLGAGFHTSGVKVGEPHRFGGRAMGADDIRPEFIKALDVVGLLWWS